MITPLRPHRPVSRGRRVIGVDPELTAALAPVLRDLDGPDGTRLRVGESDWADDVPGSAGMMLWDSGGSGTGIRVELGRPLADQIAFVADQVQEQAVEALWREGRPTNWPACPQHPATHPAAAVARDGRAYWICPVSRETISRIGGLGAP